MYEDWIILYDDGSVVRASDGPPESAPAQGVEVIAQLDPWTGYGLEYPDQDLVFGQSFFFWVHELPRPEGAEGDRWWSVGNLIDLITYRQRCTDNGIRPLFLFGYQIPRHDFKAMWKRLDRLVAEGVIPPKSGRGSREPS